MKNVVVTGAGGAIGSAVCDYLVARDIAVVALDTSPGDSSATVHYPCDVTDFVGFGALIETIEAELGPIDGLVNVAGVLARGGILTTDPAQVESVWRVNFLGTYHACKCIGERMLARRCGSIVNIGSVVGKNSGNARPWLDADELNASAGIAYGTSKAAVHSLTCFLAREFADRQVRVNAVAPGPVATTMTSDFPEVLQQQTPLARMATPSEVAAAVYFLLSDEAGFITGEILDVNGGIWCD